MCLAYPAKVLEVKEGRAAIEASGKVREVITLLPNLKPGDWVLVHADFAIQKLRRDEVKEYKRMLEA
jgi:hydrogenase expression/formation protein HypC